MQFTASFYALLAVASVALAIPTSTGSEAAEASAANPGYVVSYDEMMRWIATTDAELTFVGKPLNPLAARKAENTVVTYCTSRIGNFCGGRCTVYNGGNTCLDAPDTNCLAATGNVGFCDRTGCRGNCDQFVTCGTELDNGFCYTPNVKSIAVSTA